MLHAKVYLIFYESLITTIATKEKTIKYEQMQRVLGIESIRELEDLIIEGANDSVLKGKLDQKSKHFEVDYAMGRDIRKVSTYLDTKYVLILGQGFF